MRAGQRYHQFSADVMAQARRRRLKRVVVAIVLGIVVAAYTYGALEQRATDRDDLLPQWSEALLLGGAFAVASMPVGWAILGRALIPIPTLFLYLSVFLGKDPPLPFAAGFVLALIYCGALTTLTAFLGDRPDRPRLGLRR
jgi:drug/metabolite transporter (DMT)-like permease